MDENKFDESMYLSVISIANDCETFYDFIEHITELVKAGILIRHLQLKNIIIRIANSIRVLNLSNIKTMQRLQLFVAYLIK